MNEMLCPDVINSAGLVLDIGGVILLFLYGLPDDVRKDGESRLLLEAVDEEEIKKWKRYKRRSRLGLAFLVSGFSLQLVSNWL